MKRKPLILVSLLCILSALVSCGGETPSADPAANAVTEITEAPTPDILPESTPFSTPEVTPAPYLIYTSGGHDEQLVRDGLSREAVRFDRNLRYFDHESGEYNGALIPVMLYIGGADNSISGSIAAELERLECKGVTALGGQAEEGGFRALIPIDLIRDFPEDHSFGYNLFWLNEDVREDPEWIELLKECGADGFDSSVVPGPEHSIFMSPIGPDDPIPEATPAPLWIFTEGEWDTDILWDSYASVETIKYDCNLLSADLWSEEFDNSMIPAVLLIEAGTGIQADLHDDVLQAGSGPVISEYLDERREWVAVKEVSLNKEERAAWADAAQKGVQFGDFLNEYFYEQWCGTHAAEEREILDTALERYDEAMALLHASDETIGEEMHRRLQLEYKRLESKGIVFLASKPDDVHKYALIPIELLRNFPESHEFGYTIGWVNEGIRNGPEWNELMMVFGFEEMSENAKVR